MMKISSFLIISLLLFFQVPTAQAGFFDGISDSLNKMKSSISDGKKNTNGDVSGSPSLLTATANKASNVRSEPKKGAQKVGRIPAGGVVEVQETRGNWIRIESMGSSKKVSGWSFKPLYSMGSSKPTSASKSTDSQTSGSTVMESLVAGKQSIFPTGYAKDFQQVRHMMETGNLKGVDSFFAKREKNVLKGKSRWDAMETIGVLRWMERGSLSLDRGNIPEAIRSMGNAEKLIDEDKNKSFFKSALSWGKGEVKALATGNDEFVPYNAEGYEKVLMLNYKSISYLLNGKREAYNVTRRAIDWQNLEKENFEKKIKSNKKKIKKASAIIDKIGTDWNKSYKKLDKIAKKVPSSYVNPFGYYVAGMIQEFESRNDSSLRDNARISYKKAFKLNSKSIVLKQAVKDMKNRKFAKNRRLVHVLASIGFAPEKKVVQYNLPFMGHILPIKLPIYQPISSRVARIEVQSSAGKTIAKLSLIADIEAISLRNQKDLESSRLLKVALSTARSAGINKLSENIPLFGDMAANKANEFSMPDTRSWMSLPATVQAARFTVNKNTTKLKIVSYDKRGHRLSKKTVLLKKSSDNLIYVRALNKRLYIQSSEKLWTAH